MTHSIERILNTLETPEKYVMFSIRISRKHYHMLQEIADITGRKPASLARSCLHETLEDLYFTLLNGSEK
jgi:predicted DNA-binding protein